MKILLNLTSKFISTLWCPKLQTKIFVNQKCFLKTLASEIVFLNIFRPERFIFNLYNKKKQGTLKRMKKKIEKSREIFSPPASNWGVRTKGSERKNETKKLEL